MQLNHFTNNIDDPLHTSGFAAAAKVSAGAGSIGPQPFSRRLHIERNRQNVNRYHDSMLANRHHIERNNQRVNGTSYERPTTQSTSPESSDTATPQRHGGRLISDIVKPTVKPRFSEPSTRSYNPYK